MCPECGAEHEPDLICSRDVFSVEGTQGAVEARALPPPPPLIGQDVGSFAIEKQIGSGAMGTVFLARHKVIGGVVAAKILKPRLADSPMLVERFYAEARAVNLVGHQNIVKVFDMGKTPSGLFYMLMELLDGEPLSQLPAPAPTSVLVPVVAQICDALDAAHKVGVVHMDVKPANVFVLRRRRALSIKVLDFGAARLLSGAAGENAEGLMVGTPGFMPPEQWRREGVDGRSDVYAVGVTAYRLATGQLPFRGCSVRELVRAHLGNIPKPPHELNERLPRELSELILRALAKRKEDRFASAAEMAAAFRRVLRRRRGAAAPLALPLSVSSTYVSIERATNSFETDSGSTFESVSATSGAYEGCRSETKPWAVAT
jgi:serine/threonine protein kinase